MCLFIQASQALTIELWHLGLTAMGILIPIIGLFINLDKSRKRDLSDLLEKKADRIEVKALEKQFKKLDEDCTEKTKELKKDFIRQVELLNKEFDDKFQLLLKTIMDLMKEKKDK